VLFRSEEMSYPRLGTPAGDRAMSRCQQAYDNMTPDDVYGPDDDEPEEKAPSCDACGEVMKWVGDEWLCGCEPEGEE
jgi:hypothetical protein